MIGIPAYLLFTALISGRLYEFLHFLYSYFILIFIFSIILFQEHIQERIRSVLGKHYKENGQENHSIKKIKDIINNRLYYLFNWDLFTKDDNEKLREFLLCKFSIDWIKIPKYTKSMTIQLKSLTPQQKKIQRK